MPLAIRHVPAVPLSLSVAMLLAGNAVGAPPVYDLWIVEAFPGGSIPECYVASVNEAGVACGTSTFDGFYSGFIWTTGTEKTQIPLIWVEDINNLDQIAGDSGVYDPSTGTTTWIPGVNDYYATPYVHGLNDAGVVVGHAKGPGSDSDGVNRTPLVWDSVNGVRGIPVVGARELLRINNAAVAVGNIRHSAGDGEAFVYDVTTGEAVLLHELLSPGGAGTSSAFDISEAGTVLGKGWNGVANHAFLWSGGGGFTFLPGLNGGETLRVNPAGLNELKQVVGTARDGVTGDWRAFLWDPVEGMLDLNELVSLPTEFVLDRAREINDAGVIVGNGHFGPGLGAPRGFVLVPQTSVDTPVSAASRAERLLSLAPGATNPSRGSFAFAYEVPRGGEVRLTVHDVMGRRVSVLVGERRAEGRYRVTWDGRQQNGSTVAPGVYFVRLHTPAGDDLRRVTLIR